MSTLKRNDLSSLGASGKRLHEYLLKLEAKILALESVFYGTNKDGSNGDLVFLSDTTHPATSLLTTELFNVGMANLPTPTPERTDAEFKSACKAVTVYLYKSIRLHFSDTVAHRGAADTTRITNIDAYNADLDVTANILDLLVESSSNFAAHSNDGALHETTAVLSEAPVTALNSLADNTDFSIEATRNAWLAAIGTVMNNISSHISNPGYTLNPDGIEDIQSLTSPYNE